MTKFPEPKPLKDEDIDVTLKPCPFCGEKPEVVETRDYGMNVYTIHCTNRKCLLYFGVAPYQQASEVIQAWNWRGRYGHE